MNPPSKRILSALQPVIRLAGMPFGIEGAE
jgi:hypothetical protein